MILRLSGNYSMNSWGLILLVGYSHAKLLHSPKAKAFISLLLSLGEEEKWKLAFAKERSMVLCETKTPENT